MEAEQKLIIILRRLLGKDPLLEEERNVNDDTIDQMLMDQDFINHPVGLSEDLEVSAVCVCVCVCVCACVGVGVWVWVWVCGCVMCIACNFPQHQIVERNNTFERVVTDGFLDERQCRKLMQLARVSPMDVYIVYRCV